MNLGDGLLFELENGKPKLIVLNHGEKAQRNPAKPRPRLPSVLSCRQPSRLSTPRTEEQPIRKPIALNERSHQNKPGRAMVKGRSQTVTSSKTQEDHVPVKVVKTNAKVKPAKPQNMRLNKKTAESNTRSELQVKPSNQIEALSDSESCLTSEQLQQIITKAQTNNAPPKTEELQADYVSRNCETSETEAITEEIEAVDAPVAHKQSGGLFRWIEERPSEDRAVLEAKKAWWKKELDEQVALKKIQHSAPPRIQGEDDVENTVKVRNSISHRDLPAAIRSSLRVGEYVPLDETKLEQKLEQRRRWLQELDKQRKEITERKRLEKLQQQKTEDQQLWTSHFDSLNRSTPVPALVPRTERVEERICSSTDRAEVGGSSSLSQWEDVSVRASVETVCSSGHTSRASHLRTMTSLLDPTELEARERRRLKQLEQQRAIELQMEERRQRREEEEAQTKREEEEEERRVQQERERLQRQYERDALREKHKSNPETELSVRNSTEPPPSSNSATNQEESPELKAEPTAVNHQRDTAVQTEEVHISETPNPEPVTEAPAAIVDRAQLLQMLQMLQKGPEMYEPYARTERSKKDVKRPEWNTQRPSRRFVPASKRYPEELQRQRQENRLIRQAQLLSLQRNPINNQNHQNMDHSNGPAPNPAPQHEQNRSETHRTSQAEAAGQSTERGRSPTPPVHSESPAPGFLPYVRTDEVFRLNLQDSEPAPQLLQKTQRQQEIIRGLAQLRKGLLQKQRELELEMSHSRLDNDLRPVSATMMDYHREL